MIEDQRCLEPNDREEREEELAELVEEILCQLTTAHWMEQLESSSVVAGPIYDMERVYGDEQVLAREMKVTLDDPERGDLNHIGNPLKLSATPGSIRHRDPALSQYSREILARHGYSAAEIKGWWRGRRWQRFSCGEFPGSFEMDTSSGIQLAREADSSARSHPSRGNRILNQT